MSELQRLPSVDRVLNDERSLEAIAQLGRDLVIEAARSEIASRRSALNNGGTSLDFDVIVEAAIARAYEALRPSLRPVINATGVIIHTNLGRAPLSEDAIEAITTANQGYSNLEFDLDTGRRGSRYAHVDELVCRVTGA